MIFCQVGPTSSAISSTAAMTDDTLSSGYFVACAARAAQRSREAPPASPAIERESACARVCVCFCVCVSTVDA